MDIEKHVANWVYWTYRDLKVKPQWLERDFEKAKVILGIDDGDISYSKTYPKNL